MYDLYVTCIIQYQYCFSYYKIFIYVENIKYILIQYIIFKYDIQALYLILIVLCFFNIIYVKKLLYMFLKCILCLSCIRYLKHIIYIKHIKLLY